MEIGINSNHKNIYFKVGETNETEYLTVKQAQIVYKSLGALIESLLEYKSEYKDDSI